MSRVIQRISSAVAVVTLCALAGCASGPPKTDAQVQADKATADRVESALDADKLLYAKHITVRADNGVVRLSGFVWDPLDVDRAELIAKSVAGVSGVVNDLELQRNGNENGAVSR